MSDVPNGDSGFRITTGTVYEAVQRLERDVAALRSEQALLNQSVSNVLAVMANNAARVEKLEGRMNGVFVGIGAGVLTALVAVFRGVIG